MNWLLKFVSSDMRQTIVLGQRILASVDTAEERREAIAYGIKMLGDGKVTVGEWARFGSKLGILSGPRGKKNGPD
jgi:hypothetical protein